MAKRELGAQAEKQGKALPHRLGVERGVEESLPLQIEVELLEVEARQP